MDIRYKKRGHLGDRLCKFFILWNILRTYICIYEWWLFSAIRRKNIYNKQAKMECRDREPRWWSRDFWYCDQRHRIEIRSEPDPGASMVCRGSEWYPMVCGREAKGWKLSGTCKFLKSQISHRKIYNSYIFNGWERINVISRRPKGRNKRGTGKDKSRRYKREWKRISGYSK